MNQLPNRTAKQIRERYRLYLDPSVLHTPFTYEENLKLNQYVAQFGMKWSIIANFMDGRPDVQLKYRYRKLVRQQTKNEIAQNREFLGDPSQLNREILMIVSSDQLLNEGHVFSKLNEDSGDAILIGETEQQGKSQFEELQMKIDDILDPEFWNFSDFEFFF
jgi:hypothetical protein